MQIRHFWQALESMVGPSAVKAEWARLLKDELHWAAATGLIRCSGTLAGAYPRDPDTSASVEPYRVVSHGPDDNVGVCPDGWGTVRLSREQLLLWEVDL